MEKIRVGMIRGDLHALYYGAQMFDYDPIEMRKRGHSARPTKGYAALYYHYTHYNSPAAMTVPFVGGFQLVKTWDANPERAQVVADCFDDQVQVCDSPEQCSDDVDLLFIADCNGDGSDHLELATPGLEKGVPTFVDKPLAYSLADAVAIVKLAQDNDALMLSLSMLRVVPHGAYFRDRLQEIAPVGYGSINGGGIHGISLAQQVFGPGVEAVDCMGPTELAYLHLDYGGKPDRPEAGVMINGASGPTYHCSLYVSAFSAAGPIHSGQIGDYEFPYGSARILEMVKQMVQTGEPQWDYDQMIECIAIAEAGRLAQKEGRRVALDEVMN